MGACGYNHTKDGPLMLLRQIQVYTSHFLIDIKNDV